MQKKLAALGMVETDFAEFQHNDVQCSTLRGHTFHYSSTQSNEQILVQPITQRGHKTDPVWRKNKLIASYIHWYFPSNPQLIADLFLGNLQLS